MKTVQAWGALWRSENKLSGRTRYLICDVLPVLFQTRREARAWIDGHYGYIRKRRDLRREPYGWRMPLAVRVEVRYRLASEKP